MEEGPNPQRGPANRTAKKEMHGLVSALELCFSRIHTNNSLQVSRISTIVAATRRRRQNQATTAQALHPHHKHKGKVRDPEDATTPPRIPGSPFPWQARLSDREDNEGGGEVEFLRETHACRPPPPQEGRPTILAPKPYTPETDPPPQISAPGPRARHQLVAPLRLLQVPVTQPWVRPFPRYRLVAGAAPRFRRGLRRPRRRRRRRRSFVSASVAETLGLVARAGRGCPGCARGARRGGRASALGWRRTLPLPRTPARVRARAAGADGSRGTERTVLVIDNLTTKKKKLPRRIARRRDSGRIL